MRYRDTRDDDANVHAMVMGAGARLENMAAEQATPDPTPALLPSAPACSAADLARAIEHARRITASGAADDGTLLSRALLTVAGHLDALQAPAPKDGGEALGQMAHEEQRLYLERVGQGWFSPKPWDEQPEIVKVGWRAIGTALHAHGYARGLAAGRSEGEAERGQLQAIIDGEREGYQALLAKRDAEIARLTAERDAARSEAHASAGALLAPKIELATMGLRAELAEARAAVRELEDRLIDYSASWSVMSSWLDCREGDDAQRPGERPGVHARRMVEAARLDGAQKEREAWQKASGADSPAELSAAVESHKARAATTEEKPPIANDNRAIWPLLIAETTAGHYGGDTPEKRHLLADMTARHAFGIERYGTPLQAHNGRDALVDAYQEALDLPVYLRQAQEEGRLSRSNGLVSNAVHLALCIRMHLDDEETERTRTEGRQG